MDQRIAGASLGGGRIERFTELAAEFARLKVDLIVAATQREYTTPHACRQKKAPTERGFSSYLEADPSCLAADRNITVRAFDAPVNSAVGSVCMGNMLPIVRNCNRTSQFLFCV